MMKMQMVVQMEKINLQLNKIKQILKINKKINKLVKNPKKRMLNNKMKLLKINLLNTPTGKILIINQEFHFHNMNLFDRFKIKYSHSNEKMLKFSSFVQESFTDADRTLFILCSKQLGFKILRNFLILEKETI